jgi:hypothetical protein
MQFVKNHWMSLASGVVALAAIAVMVLGMLQKDVTEEMGKRVREASEVDSLQSGAVNQECIDAEKESAKAFDDEYKKTLEEAAKINRREPILEGVFPKAGQLELAFRFKEVYKDELYALPRDLVAGGPPSAQEIQEEAERMEEERKRRGDESPEPGGATPPAAPTPLAGGPPMAPPGIPGAPLGMTPGSATPLGLPPGAIPPGMRPGLLPTGGPLTPAVVSVTPEAQRRAAVRKARAIRIYAEADPTRSSFHVSPLALDETAPSARDMWYAQVALWIQQDVVKAIRQLNQATAERIGEGKASVETLPVKRIINVNVYGYITSQGQLVPFPAAAVSTPGASAATPLTMPPSFTLRKSDAQFDVVRFGVVVIADQRELLKLVDAFTRVNFYQLVGLEYTTLVAGSQDGDYVYGSAPVVRATLDFEGYMARKVYKALMPADVLKDLGIEGAAAPQP